jgi:hypothetical protein
MTLDEITPAQRKRGIGASLRCGITERGGRGRVAPPCTQEGPPERAFLCIRLSCRTVRGWCCDPRGPTLTCIDDSAGRLTALSDDRLRLSPTSHDQGRERSFDWIEELLAPIPVTA